MGADRSARRQYGVRHILITGLPLFFYAAFSLIYFGSWGDWSRRYFGQSSDPSTFVWFIHWWPFAIFHHLNPFVTKYVWYPHGFNVTWATSVPFAALLSLPVTLIGGPILSFNLLTLSAPVFSAWTAFLLARYLTGDWTASLVGGYLFGFSSYEFGQMLGHLNLDMTFLIPLAVLLCIQRARSEISRSCFVIGFALVMVGELGLSLEILATFCLLGAISWVVVMFFAPSADRGGLWRLAADIIFTTLVTILLAAPFMFYFIKGLPDIPPFINSTLFFSADPLNYFMPTVMNWLGRGAFAVFARQFTGAPSEQGAYLSLPLIVLIVLYGRQHANHPYAKALLVTMGLVVVLSLGPWLHIGEIQTKIPLPWLFIMKLPLMSAAMPTRLTMYVSLLAAIVAALWLAGGGKRQRLFRFALAIMACLFLMPNLSAFAWTPWPELPSLFSGRELEHPVNVLILPFNQNGLDLFWQLDAGMKFTQAGGYMGSFVPEYEQKSSVWPVIEDLYTGTAAFNFKNDFTAFCAVHGVNYILLAPDTSPMLVKEIKATGWPWHMNNGIDVIQVPPSQSLSYSYIDGDYWPSSATASWMGHRARVVTHNFPMNLSLLGLDRPMQEPVRITVAGGGERKFYDISQSSAQSIYMPEDTTLILTADQTFSPNELVHNGDTRKLSVLISLTPVK
jgi:hypothetical protein